MHRSVVTIPCSLHKYCTAFPVVATYSCLTPTHSSGYSSSGVITISNTFNGDVQTTWNSNCWVSHKANNSCELRLTETMLANHFIINYVTVVISSFKWFCKVYNIKVQKNRAHYEISFAMIHWIYVVSVKYSTVHLLVCDIFALIFNYLTAAATASFKMLAGSRICSPNYCLTTVQCSYWITCIKAQHSDYNYKKRVDAVNTSSRGSFHISPYNKLDRQYQPKAEPMADMDWELDIVPMGKQPC